MKQFYLTVSLFSLFFAFPRPSVAQDLTKNTPVAASLIPEPKAAAQGLQQWERGQDQVNGHISNSKLLKMKNITESLVSYFHDSCISDAPYSPTWHGEYFSEKSSSGPMMKFGAQCDFYEQKGRLRIMANDIGPLLDHLILNNQNYLTIRPVSDENGDCHYFESDMNNLRQKIWLITASGNRLPYVPVSRKEYLLAARMELTGARNTIVADLKQKMPIRSLSEQEMDKKAAMDQLSAMYSGADLQVRLKMFLEGYQTDEEYLKENMTKGTADLDNTLHLLDSLLSHLAVEQLNKPAIVSVQASDFQGFEDGHGDKMLIRINAACFNSTLSADKARFFLVSWQYDPSEPKANEIDKLIIQRFDSRELRDILGSR
jgi:hypothetical protein